MFKYRPFTLFVFILILFFVPFMGASYLFHHHRTIFSGTTNRGILIQPVFRIDTLRTPDWKDHWVILYWHPNLCDNACKQHIYDLHQIRIAEGKYQDTIRNVYLGTHASDQKMLEKLFPHTQTLRTTIQDKSFGSTEQIFLVDPNGFVMMRYAPNTNPEDIYHDLKHLLDISQ